MTKFEKLALSLDEKVALLKKRGLIINDEESAKNYLKFTGYYHLSGYFKYFQKQENQFIEGTTFENILDLYIFDRKLRLLTLDAIEKIEIALKATINDFITERFGCFWYLNEELFNLDFKNHKEIYDKFMKDIDLIKQRNTIFIEHFFEKYGDDEENLPSWILFEELSFGGVEKIYRILKKEFRIEIANVYNANYKDFGNRITLLKKLRNISAHYSKLFNKDYNVWLRKNDEVFSGIFTEENGEVLANYYNSALIINYLLKQINIKLGWLDDLKILFDEYKSISKENMGFSENWKNSLGA